MCGRSARNPVKIRLEGAALSVCESCAKFGHIIEIPKSVVSISGGAVIFQSKRREPQIIPKEEIAANCAALVKNAREKKGITQEELARRIPEKESVIHRIEQGRMLPDIALAKKLERALGIRLITMAAEERRELGKSGASGLTLGDLMAAKKKL